MNWHDMQLNVEDVPEKNEIVLVAIPTRKHVAYYTAVYDGNNFALPYKGTMLQYYKRGSVKGWASIRPYEVENKNV